MTLETFATQRQLRKPRKDECGDWNIIGRRGDIYVHSEGVFAVTVLRCPNATHWRNHSAKLKAAGAKVTQSGDSEGTAVFNPHDEVQAKAAIAAIRPYRRRVLSPEHRAEATARLKRLRESPPTEARQAAISDDQAANESPGEATFPAGKVIATGKQ